MDMEHTFSFTIENKESVADLLKKMDDEFKLYIMTSEDPHFVLKIGKFEREFMAAGSVRLADPEEDDGEYNTNNER